MFTVPANYNLIPYNVPDAETNDTFELFIDQEEEKRLRSILGNVLYDALIAGLAEPVVATKWTNIALGCTYKQFGKDMKWQGLEKTLVPYIYSEWIRRDFTTLTNNGTIESEDENSTKVSPARLVVESWNEFADNIGGEVEEDAVYCYEKNTLFGMLYNNRTDYDSVVATAGYSTFLQYLNEEFNYPGRKNVFNL